MSDRHPPGTPTPPDLPTLILDRYRVEEALGRGAFGSVIRAFDTRIRRPVAIKTLHRNLAARYPDQFVNVRERFEHEAEAAARMGVHPHIVAVYDLAADANDILYLILEYLPGGTLADHIARGAVPAPEALRLIADAANGLDAAHRHGIVHRDIKPANLFLTAEGRVKVGDFGVAQIDDLSQRSRLAAHHPGTPLYMSPEQTRETGYLGPESDEYALGLVLFELLTGRKYKPLGLVGAASLLHRQAPPVAALVGRMMAEVPEARYPSLGAVAASIAAMLPEIDSLEYGATRVPPPLPPSAPDERHISRRGVLAGIGGVIVLGGVAAGVWAKQHADDGGPPTVLASVTSSPAPATPTATATPATTAVSASTAATPGTVIPPTTPLTAPPTVLPSRAPTTVGPTVGPSTTPTVEGITVTPIGALIPNDRSNATFTFRNTGAAVVTLTRTERPPEYDADPNQVTLRPGESAVITVTINRTRLVAGQTYAFFVTFVSTAGVSAGWRLAFQG